MMGSGDQPGLIPRLCSALFERMQKEQREEEVSTVEVSYMEIYNEKVRDLLDPKGYVSGRWLVSAGLSVPQPASHLLSQYLTVFPIHVGCNDYCCSFCSVVVTVGSDM